jgi:hypothetical protein
MDPNLSPNTRDDLFTDTASTGWCEKCTDKLQGMNIQRNTVKTLY